MPGMEKRSVLIGGVAGLVVGALVVGLAWVISAKTGGGSAQDRDIATACDLLARADLHKTPAHPSKKDLNRMYVSNARVGAALSLAMGISETDHTHQAFSKALNAVNVAIAQEYRVSQRALDAATKARSYC